MAVSFAPVTNRWKDCSINAGTKRQIYDILDRHGSSGCRNASGIREIRREEHPQYGELTVCLYDKYIIKFRCDPALSLTRVVYMTHVTVADRMAILGANPTLIDFGFVHARDRRQLQLVS